MKVSASEKDKECDIANAKVKDEKCNVDSAKVENEEIGIVLISNRNEQESKSTIRAETTQRKFEDEESQT